MTIETIRERVQRKDFRSCDLHIADGRIIHIATPDHLFMSPTNREFVVFSAPPNERVEILDVESHRSDRKVREEGTKERALVFGRTTSIRCWRAGSLRWIARPPR